MIGVFGAGSDPHVRAVLGHLNSLSSEYQLLDIYDENCSGYSASIDSDVFLSFGRGDTPSHRYKSIWWRIKPPFRIATDDLTSYYDQKFSSDEWQGTLGYFDEAFNDAFWMNPRDKARSASNKINQLLAARKCGFHVPRTIFSNNYHSILEFMKKNPEALYIIKTITPYISPDGKIKYTDFIDNEGVELLGANISMCPVIIQEYVRPKFEIRATTVENEIFSAKITKKDQSSPDWRRETTLDIYDKYSGNLDFSYKLNTMNDMFGINFGAYDFVLDSEDNMFFLEVNPSGQWLWLEERLGLQISSRIAETLAKKS